MIVLAIESTCDETGAAVARESPPGVEILSDVMASSAEILSKYGGVVPEVAAREQVAAIIPVIEEAIGQMANGKWQMAIDQIDAIAVTQGPGLIGSLLIGVETAKTLALAWKKPLIKVNHMAAHVFANWIQPNSTVPGVHSATWEEELPDDRSWQIANSKWQAPELPAVALIVSGGHTDIMHLASLTDWQWIGGTRDDAAGEAFDKAARTMGFPYPGGPTISRLAAQMAYSKWHIADSLKLPRPMIHENNLEMSFSGLKTALIQRMADGAWQMDDRNRALLAREFNEAIVEVLVTKTMKAVERYQPKSVLLAGGVAANRQLRDGLMKAVKEAGIEFFMPDLKYCTDNAAMIAACALMRPDYIDPLKLRPIPGLEIT